MSVVCAVRKRVTPLAKRNHIRKVLFAALTSSALILGATRSAEAISITPGSALQISTTTYNSTINTPEEWLQYLGLTPAPYLLYKSNVDKTSVIGLGLDE